VPGGDPERHLSTRRESTCPEGILVDPVQPGSTYATPGVNVDETGSKSITGIDPSKSKIRYVKRILDVNLAQFRDRY